jgi:hypothetical protein
LAEHGTDQHGNRALDWQRTGEAAFASGDAQGYRSESIEIKGLSIMSAI